jgi:hypothetical protein
MNTYFIIGYRDPRTVWHYTRKEWCSDVDAEYGRGFEYRNADYARFRADILSAHGTPADVVTRERLFEMLGVKDWAGPSK